MKKRHILIITLLVIIGVPALIWGHRDIPLEVLKQRYANADSRFVSIEGMPVHNRVEGNPADTVPLLLLHGTGASLHTWDGWVGVMQGSRRIVRLDLPAFGLTGPTADGIYSAEMYQRVVIALLDSLGIDKADIAGNSLGGYIAWYTALHHPDRVRNLVLIDAAGYPLEQSEKPLAFRLAAIPGVNIIFKFITPRSVVEKSLTNLYVDDTKVTPALVDRYFELALRPGNRQAFLDRAKTIPSDTSYRRMSTITHRTLILWGAEDYFIPGSMAHRFARDLPNDTLVIVPNTGHVPMEELPEYTAQLALEFLRSR